MINNDINNVINLIKDSASEFLPDSKILLFGSRARNDSTSESDYDFLIITQEQIDISTKREYKSKLRRILARHGIPADILIQSKSEVELKRNVIGHIIRQAIIEGKQI